jgi:biotin/methionine sulfoxide reductase
VLTLDIGTSRLTQGPSALSALVDIERWNAPLPPVNAWTPPAFCTRPPDERLEGIP